MYMYIHCIIYMYVADLHVRLSMALILMGVAVYQGAWLL